MATARHANHAVPSCQLSWRDGLLVAPQPQATADRAVLTDFSLSPSAADHHASGSMALLEVEDLTCHFHTRDGLVRAVDGVSFSVDPGETLGIVGESGSGKSVTCYALLGLLPQPPARIRGTAARFDGADLLNMPDRALRRVRGKRIAMIFQDPMTSLNPYLRISTQLIEPLCVHDGLNRRDALARAIEALEEVGITDAANRIHRYPHEFSGGMRQRVMIAMALITRPEILIADEPTTALDVTVQAQILELIKRFQKELGTAVILVTHDLGVVAGSCDRVSVMYAGKFVESGPVDDLFHDARHAYTIALRRSIPGLQKKGEILFTIPGNPAQIVGDRPPGPAFAPRSNLPFTAEEASQPAEWIEVTPGHWVESHPATTGQRS